MVPINPKSHQLHRPTTWFADYKAPDLIGRGRVLRRELDPGDTIYRYMSIERVLEVLDTRRLILVSPRKWHDPYEEWWCDQLFALGSKLASANAFGSCWTRSYLDEPRWRLAVLHMHAQAREQCDVSVPQETWPADRNLLFRREGPPAQADAPQVDAAALRQAHPAHQGLAGGQRQAQIALHRRRQVFQAGGVETRGLGRAGFGVEPRGQRARLRPQAATATRAQQGDRGRQGGQGG